MSCNPSEVKMMSFAYCVAIGANMIAGPQDVKLSWVRNARKNIGFPGAFPAASDAWQLSSHKVNKSFR
jgi:hypothetical protein